MKEPLMLFNQLGLKTTSPGARGVQLELTILGLQQLAGITVAAISSIK